MKSTKEICGARLTTNMGRIMVSKDFTPEAFELLDTFYEEFPVAWKEFENFEKKQNFMDRTVNVGRLLLNKQCLQLTVQITCSGLI
jgi:NADH-quinone oxidoreductase subunit D